MDDRSPRACRAARVLAVLAVLILPAARAQAQLTISGQADFVGRTIDGSTLPVNGTSGHSPFDDLRIRLFAHHWLNDRIGFFGELLFDNDYEPQIIGAYMVVNELAGHDWLNARLGLAPSLIGNYGMRSSYFNANPLIGLPLVWAYRTTLDGTGAATAEAMMARRASNEQGLWVLYDAWWNLQWELLGEVGRFEYSIGVTPGSVSSPSARKDDGAQILARAGFEPTPGLRLGVSGAWGPYIDRRDARGDSIFPGGPADYAQLLTGYDAEYSVGKVRLFSEGYYSSWQAPLIADRLTLSAAYIEGRYNFTAGWYVASRFDRMVFGKIAPTSAGTGVRTGWDDDLWRIESAVGYRIAREVLLKADWQHTAFTTGTDAPQNIFAAQLSVVF